MKILLDQNVPRPLAKLLTGHEVTRAAELGWAELKNGNLLSAAEEADFEVLLSGDKTIRHEQNMTARRIALLCMSGNHWPIVKGYVEPILLAIERAVPGEVRLIDCGIFVPKRFRSPQLRMLP